MDIQIDNEKSNTHDSNHNLDHEIIAHYTKDDSSPPVERVKFEGLSESEDSVSSDVQDKESSPIPDGGWGWVVVASAFVVSACADGLGFSYGLLQEEFTNYFKGNQSKISLIGSLFIATPLLAGPVMSALVDRYGCRVMTMIAGILSTLSFLLASLSNSVEMLCLTFGVMAGLAMGVLYVTAVVSVAFWFDKRRNLAFSLASSGIGFGTLIYSPMTHYFLQVYDWRNTIVLLSGTLLNMCVCGALMRTPEWLEEKQKKERRSRKSSSAGSISSYSRSVGGESIFLTADELNTLMKSGKSPEYILQVLRMNIAEAEQLEATTQINTEQTCRRIQSDVHLPTYIQHKEMVPQEVIEKLFMNKRIYNIIVDNYPQLVTRRKSEIHINSPTSENSDHGKLPLKVLYEAQVDKNSKTTTQHGKNNNINNKNENSNIKSKEDEDHKTNENAKHSKETLRPSWFTRQLSTDHHYLQNVPLYRNAMSYRSAMLTLPRYKLKASSLPDIYRNSMWSLGSDSDEDMKWNLRIWNTVKASFNFKMYTEFHFFMFNLCMVILSVWFIVPYFFLKSFMSSQNMEGGEVMISIIGIANAIGIVALGWTGDQPWIDVTKAFSYCLIISGLSVAAYPIVITNRLALCLNSAVFGFSFASSYSYSPAILMNLIPIDHFTVAYGLVLLAQGIGHLVGPPIGGLLFDLTGTWNLTFYAAGFWLVISGLCLIVIACTRNMRMCGQAPLLNDVTKIEQSQDA